MPAKILSISLPESLAWKLEQLEQRHGVPRSSLIQKAILLLVSEMSAVGFEFGEIGQDFTQEDIETEYQKLKEPNK